MRRWRGLLVELLRLRRVGRSYSREAREARQDKVSSEELQSARDRTIQRPNVL
jgi:hypothetical protein